MRWQYIRQLIPLDFDGMGLKLPNWGRFIESGDRIFPGRDGELRFSAALVSALKQPDKPVLVRNLDRLLDRCGFKGLPSDRLACLYMGFLILGSRTEEEVAASPYKRTLRAAARRRATRS